MDQLLALFNIAGLDDHQIGHLQWVLNSPSYFDVFKPYLENMRATANQLMLDRSQGRKDNYPDDFLAGQIVAIDGLLTLFEKLLNETDFEKIRASQDTLTEPQEYQRALAEGRIKPAGVNTDDNYDPAEDF